MDRPTWLLNEAQCPHILDCAAVSLLHPPQHRPPSLLALASCLCWPPRKPPQLDWRTSHSHRPSLLVWAAARSLLLSSFVRPHLRPRYTLCAPPIPRVLSRFQGLNSFCGFSCCPRPSIFLSSAPHRRARPSSATTFSTTNACAWCCASHTVTASYGRSGAEFHVLREMHSVQMKLEAEWEWRWHNGRHNMWMRHQSAGRGRRKDMGSDG